MARLHFGTFPSASAAAVAKQYLHSRLNRAVAVHGAVSVARPMKVTGAYTEFSQLRLVLRALHERGITRLDGVTQAVLDTLVRSWSAECTPDTLAGRISMFTKLAAHGPFLTTDQLSFAPWPGRHANQIAGHSSPPENITPRIPEQIMAPLLRAAVFYVRTAAADLLTAHRELQALTAALPTSRCQPADIPARLRAFVEHRRAQQRGLPALPAGLRDRFPDATEIDGVVQAPNQSLIWLMAGVHAAAPYRQLLIAAGAELGTSKVASTPPCPRGRTPACHGDPVWIRGAWPPS
ncbi:hypothetical protein [Actinoplanes sp. NPDC051411]|uniref:hypothetical protein n=1 Tax=Actinoplanes sp. NPDC051411 TaxID=3155522 RepID=UPI003430EC86